jgi:hypothetical protein
MLGIGVKEEGREEFTALLRQIEQLDTRFSGVELIGARKDGVDSEIIVDTLTDRDRDFFSPSSDICDATAEGCAKEIERRMSYALKEGRPDPSDDVLAVSGLIAAMKAYAAAVVELIRAQRTASGGAPRALTEQYAQQKKRRFGFVEPIGVASAQLLNALTMGGSAAGKIRPVRK